MASSTTVTAAAAKNIKIGYFVQLGGIVAFATGVILSAHHVTIGAAFVGGVAAFYVGQKIRTMA
jgi:ribosomal protein S1